MGVVPYEDELLKQIRFYKINLDYLVSQDMKPLGSIWYCEGCLEGSRWLLRSYTCGANRRYILAGLIRKQNLMKKHPRGSYDEVYLRGYCAVVRKHLSDK